MLQIGLVERCIVRGADSFLPKPLNLALVGTAWQYFLHKAPRDFRARIGGDPLRREPTSASGLLRELVELDHEAPVEGDGEDCSLQKPVPVVQGAIAGVAGVPMEAVRIIAIQTQRRHLRRRLEASTVVVDYEIEATNSEAVARKLAETTPADFDSVIQDVAAAAGAGAAFADVRTEEISVASAEASEEEDDEDDASTSKFASVKFIASVALHRRMKYALWCPFR